MKFSNQGGGQFLNDIPTIPLGLFFNQTVTPHTINTRITGTPAVGRAWILTGIGISIQQQTVGTVNGMSEADVTIDPQGSGQIEIARLHLWHSLTLTGKQLFIPCHHRLINADQLRARTTDGNTDGWIEWDINISGYEVAL